MTDRVQANGGNEATMLRHELHSVILRYSQEADTLTIYQALGVLRVIEHDLMGMLESANSKRG